MCPHKPRPSKTYNNGKGWMFWNEIPSQSPRELTIMDQIARLLVKDLRPYSMVDGDEFVRFVKILDPW